MTSKATNPDPHKGSQGEPAWASDPGARRAERYVLGPELGRGGMGRVHLGWDPMLRRMVAIKLLVGDDPELHLRLLREARSQAKLDHPNVCRIHDLGMEEDRPYIAMQLILGNSLSELRPELDHRQMAELLADVAGAVQAAHRAGLIHRDLKPANILVTGRSLAKAAGEKKKALLDSGGLPVLGQLKPYVVDFGLARDLQALDQTLSWAVMGTPAFMSPEQARGEALGPATDIYSLGATLYAMLSGKPPYEGSTLAGLITQQSERGVRAIRRMDRSVPRDLETIALKCLEREPARRYGSARELELDLRRWLAGKPILARPVGPFGRLWRWSRRKPTLAGTAAAGLAATVVLGGWNVRTTRQARQREEAAQRFALEIRDAEHLLRIERMMPIHDIRPAEGRLRARMDAIRKEMEKLGGIAKGPGLYALGRGHLALREPKKAIEALDGAWNEGFHAPEVAYAQALARLRLFESLVMDNFIGSAHPELAPKAQAELVVPALRMLRDAKGALVDNREYGYALAAWASGRHREAEEGFKAVLEQSPWLAEAWTGRFRNLLMWKWQDRMSPGEIDRLCAQLEVMLREAERLAPSDDEPVLVHTLFDHSQFIRKSARKDRSEAPLVEASGYLEKTRVIRPGTTDQVLLTEGIATQRGFCQLSAGKDPGPMVRDAARLVEQNLERADWDRPESRDRARKELHHVWMIAAEADWRFGRDPRPAIAQAAATRRFFPTQDAHFVYPVIIHARYRIARGLDPLPQFREGEEILKSMPNGLDVFLRSIYGELCLDWSEWSWSQGQDADGRARTAAELLEQSVKEDPAFAYTYYSLPSLHALRARIALARGQDPSVHVRAALAAAARGVAANPDSAKIRVAAAEASLAEAEARAARGADPMPGLEGARRHLAVGRRTDPRDFRLALVAARVERLCAAWDCDQGKDPSRALDRVAAACRWGLAAKPDEPRLKEILAHVGVHPVLDRVLHGT